MLQLKVDMTPNNGRVCQFQTIEMDRKMERCERKNRRSGSGAVSDGRRKRWSGSGRLWRGDKTALQFSECSLLFTVRLRVMQRTVLLS